MGGPATATFKELLILVSIIFFGFLFIIPFHSTWMLLASSSAILAVPFLVGLKKNDFAYILASSQFVLVWYCLEHEWWPIVYPLPFFLMLPIIKFSDFILKAASMKASPGEIVFFIGLALAVIQWFLIGKGLSRLIRILSREQNSFKKLFFRLQTYILIGVIALFSLNPSPWLNHMKEDPAAHKKAGDMSNPRFALSTPTRN